MYYSLDNLAVFTSVCISIAIRGMVSLSSYSGATKPPMYGDYEAQRHWQEITFNLPAQQWYINSTYNDLLYWGLDYPPLTGYHSYVLGVIANNLNQSYVDLLNSRGIESAEHKSFMRLSVLAGDLFVYIPASLFAVSALESLYENSAKWKLSCLILLLFYPCQILIDNGHFQYNNISLGLFLLSVASLMHNRYKWASIAFSLAINYKQMELYHAIPIFVYLLKTSLTSKLILKNISNLLKIGFVTVTTFTLLWMPWISSINSLITTVLRLFPLKRGVFEDKVANIWCSLNIIYKLKQNIKNEHMTLICMGSTLLATVPANVHLFCNFKNKTFLFTLVNTSLAFFLFSFQVHEKSILLAAVPTCFIFKFMPFSVLCFLKISTFSVLPLLIKDNLCLNYFCMIISYFVIFKCLIQVVFSIDNKTNQKLCIIMNLLDVIMVATSLATLSIQPPEKFPYLWPLIISFSSCMYFSLFLFQLNFYQFNNFQ